VQHRLHWNIKCVEIGILSISECNALFLYIIYIRNNILSSYTTITSIQLLTKYNKYLVIYIFAWKFLHYIMQKNNMIQSVQMFVLKSTHLLTFLQSWALPKKQPIMQPFRKFPTILRNPKVDHRVHRALHWSLSWASSIQSIPSHPISLRSILILSCVLVFLLVSFLLAFPSISYTHSSFPHSCYMPCPYHSPWLDRSNYVWRGVQVLPVVLYGCETWSLTLWEEHRLRVFENRVLRRIFGPMRDDVTGDWRKLHNDELHNLYWHP
jgi:hypothetical protein